MSYKLPEPKETSFTFYGANKDKSGNYSSPTEITLYYPEIEPLVIDENLITIDNNLLEVRLPRVRNRVDVLTGNTLPSNEREYREVLGYVIRLNNVEFYTGETYDDKNIKITASELEEVSQNPNQYVTTLELPKYSAWDLEIGAYDTVSNPDVNNTLFESTFSDSYEIRPPHIPSNITSSITLVEKIPSQPTNFHSLISGDSDVRIFWDEPSEYVEQYKIEMSYSSDFSTIENTFYSKSNSLVVSGLGVNELVYFRIIAIGLSYPRVDLDWDDNPTTDNIGEYEIQYRLQDVATSSWTSVTVEGSSDELDLEPDTNYEFRIRAINQDDRVSKWSNIFSVSLPEMSNNESSSLTGNVDMPELLSLSVTAMEDAWTNINTLMDADFYSDTTDNFSGENITPNTIKTQAISIGSPLRAYDLQGIDFTPNLNNNRGDISWSDGQLVRILAPEESESDFDVTIWYIDSGTQTALTSGEEYYVYAKCSKTYDQDATIQFSLTRPNFDDGGYYNFMVGVLNTNQSPAIFASSYGFTFIDGGQLTTGTINANNANIVGGGGAIKIDGQGIRGGVASGGDITDVKFEIDTSGNVTLEGNLTVGSTIDGESIESEAGAISKANTAEQNAISHSDGYLNDLGFLSYAESGQTIVSGGYLDTIFVNAERIDTGILNANNVTIESDLGNTFQLDDLGIYINSPNFTLEKDGSIEATEFSLLGNEFTLNKSLFHFNITGTDFELDSNGLKISTDNFTLNKDGSAIFSGNLDAASGRLGNTSNYIEFDGSNLLIESPNLSLDANNATISGDITASGGQFILDSDGFKIYDEVYTDRVIGQIYENYQGGRIELLDRDENRIARLGVDSTYFDSGQETSGALSLYNEYENRVAKLHTRNNAYNQADGVLELTTNTTTTSGDRVNQIYPMGFIVRHHDGSSMKAAAVLEVTTSGNINFDFPAKLPTSSSGAGSNGFWVDSNGYVRSNQ